MVCEEILSNGRSVVAKGPSTVCLVVEVLISYNYRPARRISTGLGNDGITAKRSIFQQSHSANLRSQFIPLKF